ncbi:MAG: CofH family radical SAM protein [Candidatus Eremiobacterota bacterium]
MKIIKHNELIDYLSDPLMKEIAQKVLSDERLTEEEGIFLFQYEHIFETGLLADFIRRKKIGDFAFYGNNLNINHTNICEKKCPICAFSKDEGEEGAYIMTLDEIFKKVETYRDSGIEEVHIVGGVNKYITLSYLEEMFSGIKRINEKFHIQALTAVEYDYISSKEGISLDNVFKRLKKAGLGSVPGGGAEIFNREIRNIIAPEKISGDRWLEVSEQAHIQGIHTNATMLYGHIESYGDRIDHMVKLREVQDKTGGFMAFVPLTFHPYNTEFEHMVKEKTDIYDILKVIAVSRLMLDNFDHIKALWMYMGQEFIEIALHMGADDLGSTSIEEQIVKSAGGKTKNIMKNEDFEDIIIKSGFVPRRVVSNYGI